MTTWTLRIATPEHPEGDPNRGKSTAECLPGEHFPPMTILVHPPVTIGLDEPPPDAMFRPRLIPDCYRLVSANEATRVATYRREL